MEYRHGPISIAAPGRAVWPFGPLPPGLADQMRATGATLVDTGDLDPLAALVLAQRFAVAAAEARGLDPDQPRNLTRSVILPVDGGDRHDVHVDSARPVLAGARRWPPLAMRGVACVAAVA